MRAPSLRSVRRAASRPTSAGGSSSARWRRAVQWKPRRFLPPSSAATGTTLSDWYEPLVARAEPAREHDGRAARGPPERRPLAVGDARVEGERRGLALAWPWRWRAPRRPRRRRDRRGRGRRPSTDRRGASDRPGPAKGSSCERPTSSMASETKRSSPASVRSLVDVEATRLCWMTRSPAERVPASSTSSGSPLRTLAESSAPERSTHSATRSAPPRSRAMRRMRSPSSSSSPSSRSRGDVMGGT